jgi:hypothetical protein
MDLSKLPRLSNTPTSPAPEPAAAEAPKPVIAAAPSAMALAGDVWISLIVGVLLIVMGFRFAKYAACALAGRTYDTGVTWTDGPNAGTPVGFWELDGHEALTDTAMFLFGLVLALDAGAMVAGAVLSGRAARTIVVAFMALTIAGTLFNLYAAIVLWAAGIVPILSALAVAFGGYIFVSQARQLMVARFRSPQ